MAAKAKSKPLVGILMGSKSDLEVMTRAAAKLESLGIAHEVVVTSAHRSPDQTCDYARRAKQRGIKVFIVGAGRAAHPAGAVAANTTLPVRGVPIRVCEPIGPPPSRPYIRRFDRRAIKERDQGSAVLRDTWAKLP